IAVTVLKLIMENSFQCLVKAGAYELPKVAKERGTGRGYLCMYMAIASTNRRALSIFGSCCA
ncbi:MAG: hypothetical protein MJE68_11140, partial [Proteobacteria bacterium]|nr:hypothetical protein [Pseudomonadota bacterium]